MFTDSQVVQTILTKKMTLKLALMEAIQASIRECFTFLTPTMQESSLTDIGGRTVQVLPRETQVSGQDWRTTNYNLHRENVIISLPYIG